MSLDTRPARDASASPASPAGEVSSRAGLAAAVAAFAALSLWAVAPVLYLLHRAAPGDRLTGADSIFPGDQLQYIAWVRSAGAHVLAADDFVLRQGGHDFLHPMFLISGLLWRAGASLALSYLIWIPVAVVVLFEGYRRYIWRMCHSPGARAAGLLLALFFVTPLDPLVGWTVGSNGLGTIAGELAPTGSLWGYLPVTISTGLLPLYVLALERMVTPDASGRTARTGRAALTASAIGGLAGWLHPWQGEVLVLLALSPLLMAAGRRHARQVLVAVMGPALALVYYLALSRADPTWALAQTQSAPPHPNVLLLIAGLAPLLALAAVQLRVLARSRPLAPADALLAGWPVAALLVYFLSPGYSLHALEGLALPLTVLSVRAWQRLGWPRWAAVAAIVAATVPGLAFDAQLLHDTVRATANGLLLRGDETRALAYLANRPGTGGVLASLNIADEIPAYAGRRTWLGHPSWTPDYPARAAQLDALFAGRLSAATAAEFVRSTGARYVLADCQPTFSGALISAMHPAVTRFGCVLVYTIPGSPTAASL